MLYFSKNTLQSKHLSKQFLEQKLRRIYRGIYTDDLQTPLEKIVLQNWMAIVSDVVTHGILSYRTAIDLKPQPFQNQHLVFITSSYTKTIRIHGLIIKVYAGEHEQFLEQILPNLARSNTARMILENLSSIRRVAYTNIKTIGINGVEHLLTKELHLRGEKRLNQIRDQAKIIAEKLNYKKEYENLNQIISALLSTNHSAILSAPYAKAAALQKPYDDRRIKLFDELIVYLKKCHFLDRNYHYQRQSFKNLSFYESYFSNYIEGTEFIIDEAEDIIFKGAEIENRHAESHDVLANFTITHDYSEMNITPNNQSEFIEILQNRHAILMNERPEKRPGEFKQKPNKAGNTFFVDPKEVLGTLYKGFERYKLLNSGLEKALFMQFLISEVHPFEDGNGRLSRLMMNAELLSNTNIKIIIPAVLRDNYLNGLRLATKDHQFRTYVKMMDQAQAYTASINWPDYGESRQKIEDDNANLHSDEGLPTFNRVLRGLDLSVIPLG